MKTGFYISGAGHLALILWVLLGGVFFQQAEPEVLDATDVSLISTAEYMSLTATRPEPLAAQDVAEPTPPATDDTAAQASAGDEPPRIAPRPDPADPAEPEVQPDRPDLTTPVAEVEATAPDAPQAPVAQDMAAMLPPALQPGRPTDAPRVAATPTPETLPLTQDAPEFTPPAPLPQPDPPVNETQTQPDPDPDREDPAAPQETTTEIVTEADLAEPEGAPVTGFPPRLRPAPEVVAGDARPATQPLPDTPATTPTDESPQSASDTTSPEPETPLPVGPPLNFGEVDRLVAALQNCWSIGTLSTAAASSTVVVGLTMNPDGKPVTSSIRMLSGNGPDDRAVKTAYDYARRAVMRCGRDGFPLPSEKFAHWAEIEITFSPEDGLLFE